MAPPFKWGGPKKGCLKLQNLEKSTKKIDTIDLKQLQIQNCIAVLFINLVLLYKFYQFTNFELVSISDSKWLFLNGYFKLQWVDFVVLLIQQWLTIGQYNSNINQDSKDSLYSINSRQTSYDDGYVKNPKTKLDTSSSLLDLKLANNEFCFGKPKPATKIKTNRNQHNTHIMQDNLTFQNNEMIDVSKKLNDLDDNWPSDLDDNWPSDLDISKLPKDQQEQIVKQAVSIIINEYRIVDQLSTNITNTINTSFPEMIKQIYSIIVKINPIIYKLLMLRKLLMQLIKPFLQQNSEKNLALTDSTTVNYTTIPQEFNHHPNEHSNTAIKGNEFLLALNLCRSKPRQKPKTSFNQSRNRLAIFYYTFPECNYQTFYRLHLSNCDRYLTHPRISILEMLKLRYL